MTTLNQVQENREANVRVIFNKEAALMALKTAAVHKSHGGRSSNGTSKASILIECFKTAGQPLSVNQAEEMFCASQGVKLDTKLSHSLSSILWAMSDRDTKRKTPAKLKYDTTTDMYTLA